MLTSTHGNFEQSLAANTHRRATAGVGIIATPYYPYHNDSIWNRNQLGGFGDLGTLSMTEWLIIGLIGYFAFAKMHLARKIGL